MSSLSERIQKLIPHLTIYSIVAYFTSKLFYCQIFLGTKAYCRSDMGTHLFISYKLSQGDLVTSNPGYHAVVAFVIKIVEMFTTLNQINVRWAAVIATTALMLFLLYVTYWVLKKFLANRFNDWVLLISSVLINLVTAIYLPFFNKFILVGQSSPTTWHNATQLALKPLAILTYTLFLLFLADKDKRNSFWHGLVISILLLLTTIAKPSFMIIFLPALGIYILWKHVKEFEYYWKSFLIALPMMTLVAFQYIDIFVKSSHVEKNSIVLDMFKLWSSYSPFVPVSVLLAIAFPLSILIFRFEIIKTNSFLLIAWLQYIVGFAQVGFFAESGSRYDHGNFFWGYNIALAILFLYSGLEFMKWYSDRDEKNSSESLKFKASTSLLTLHIASGLYYFIILSMGKAYY